MRFLICFFCFVLFIPVYAEEMELEIIPLKHRLTDDVLPVLRPLLTPGGSLSGMNNQLIVKTTAQNLQEIRQTLNAIDQPLRSLRISVRYDNQDSQSLREHGIEGEYRYGNVRIETGGPAHSDQSRRRQDDAHGEIRYRSWSTNSQSNDNSVYFVRTVEGQPAWIRTGETVPYPERTIVLHPYGTDIYDTVNYVDISSGFYVVPLLRGDAVTLMISPGQRELDESNGGTINSREAEMTVRGQLGTWIRLGGITEQYHDQLDQGLHQTRHYGNEENHIWVMVEETH